MAVTQVDKMKILKFFRENAFGDIYYNDLVEYLGKKSKIADIEFVEFFVTYVIDSLKRENPSFNLLNKMVSTLDSFIGWLNNDKVEINLEILNKLYDVRNSYEQHLITFQVERNELLEELISILEKDLKSYYPKKTTEDIDVNIEELLAELETLRNELSDNEKEIADLTSKLSKQTKNCENKKKDNVKLSSKLETSKKEKLKLEEEIKKLEDKIEQLMNEVASLQSELISSREDYTLLSNSKDKIQNDFYSLKQEIKDLRKKLSDKEREVIHLQEENEFKIIVPRSIDYNEDKNNKIEALIIQKMLTGKNTLDDVREYLAGMGYILSIDELRIHFKSIKAKMRYENPEVSDVTEVVADIDVKEDNEYMISLDKDSKCVDLMVVSDFHLSTFGKEIIADMELINDYCEENGINIILNTGDFFSWTRLKGKHNGTACQKIVDKAIAKYPVRNGIKHAILGGNHDKDMLSVGVDPLKLLEEARDDFISLGYSHCKITFGGSVSILEGIGMHHPNRRYSEPVGKEVYATDKIRESVNNYYANGKISSDDVYADLLGHIHKSGLDTQNGICIVPSYRKDRMINGAWHLKVYFSDDGHISNIVFIPVIKSKKLIPMTEINYKKQLILK